MAGRANYITFIVVLLLAGTFTDCRHIKESSCLPAAHTVGSVQAPSPETITASPIQLAFKFID